MTPVENAKEATPANTESVSSVRSTLIPTFPHKMVVRRKLESLRILRTLIARVDLASSAAISRRSLVRLKNAKLRPENMADWVTQKKIPAQINEFPILFFCYQRVRLAITFYMTILFLNGHTEYLDFKDSHMLLVTCRLKNLYSLIGYIT